jgi:prepilin-type N-terminal cleavage/methylation domain-containing protein/prepilin-type processing-associated H-X9-DG protein
LFGGSFGNGADLGRQEIALAEEQGVEAMRLVEIESANGAHRQAGCREDNGGAPIVAPEAFTLIELLVVISILVLLMAILLPVLGQVRKQARALACQAKLRQWGMVFAAYTNDYEGRFYPWAAAVARTILGVGSWEWPYHMRQYYRDCNDLLLCPAASRKPVISVDTIWMPATDLDGAWCTSGVLPSKFRVRYFGSYGLNGWIGTGSLAAGPTPEEISRGTWGGRPVRNRGNVPVLIDSLGCVLWYEYGKVEWKPPAYEGEPSGGCGSMNYACLDRHGGGVNSMFMDWSVRKVGVKELWVLKWFKEYDTAGYWTKAGGRTPEDWPVWMRRFKDY